MDKYFFTSILTPQLKNGTFILSNTKIKQTFLFILIASMFVACGELNTSSSFKPNCSGPPGEVLIVIDKPDWESKTGDTIFSLLSKSFPALPQSEATFKIIHITHDLFRSTGYTHRNIIFVNINSKYKKTKVTLEYNRWSKPQLLYTFTAPSEEEFIKLFVRNHESVSEKILDEERKRLVNLYKKYQSIEIDRILRQEHELTITCPTDYNLDVTKDNFVWISNETSKTSQGIFIYYYNYKDTNSFAVERLVAVRDSITKRYVPGPEEDTYMTTEKLLPAYKEVFQLNDKYACKIRGLWKTHNYLLGGPYVSVSIVDEKRNRIITADGYVYAGMQDKKKFLWQVEAILHTIKAI